MIAAGLLKDYVTFEKSSTIQSASGARTTEWIMAYKCKAYVPRKSSKSEIVNYEDTYTGSVTITIRKVKDIDRKWRFLFNDDRYSISDIQFNRSDRTYVILGEKINE